MTTLNLRRIINSYKAFLSETFSFISLSKLFRDFLFTKYISVHLKAMRFK